MLNDNNKHAQYSYFLWFQMLFLWIKFLTHRTYSNIIQTRAITSHPAEL